MQISFYKYHGTGNDFILIDNFKNILDINDFTAELVSRLCHRRFGIGADGLIILQKHPEMDFEMIYFNSDGNPGSMCGNGGRCIVALAHSLGYIGQECIFIAADGPHKSMLADEVSLRLKDVSRIEIQNGHYIMDTGSPHYVVVTNGVRQMDLHQKAKEIRYGSRFEEKGINVNFVEMINNEYYLRTYERGVEDETMSCGTGVTATAISLAVHFNLEEGDVDIVTPGGRLNVRFERAGDTFKNIWLTGPAVESFRGTVQI